MHGNPVHLTKEALIDKAHAMRIRLIETLATAPSGHTGGPLGLADIFTYLYFHELTYDAHNPRDDMRDRMYVSNGHVCPIWYVCLAEAGFFPIEELKTLRRLNSRLQGHPHNLSTPGIENTSGPLGQGISQAAGSALRAQVDKKTYRIFCLVSDAECQEGEFWEALLFIHKYHLDQLFIIIDNNNVQIDGFVQDVMPITPLAEKLQAFGLDVFSMNGNDMGDIMKVMQNAQETKGNGQAKIIIANTILGCGVPFMENNYIWHGIVPSKQQAAEALRYLENK